MKGKRFDIERIKRGECYISEVTRVEIMSVMGKYARGEQAQWQICNRITGDDGTRCSLRHYNPGRKRWKRKQIAAFRKLIDDIVNGRSSVFKVAVLPITHEVVSEAERFIDLAFKYKFASMDAMIAATAKCYGTDEICVVTHDGSLRSPGYILWMRSHGNRWIYVRQSERDLLSFSLKSIILGIYMNIIIC